jgi:hypothetical protein
MARRASNRAGLILAAALSLTLVVSCSDDPSTRPTDNGPAHLAGGGRDRGDDPFAGGPEGSGPTRPDFDYPDPSIVPLFYSEVDCQNSPSQRLIANETEWQAWWDAANACLGLGGGPNPGRPPDGDPDSIFPEPGGMPPVDFEKDVVLVISLEPDTSFGRGVWVTEVIDSPSGAMVRYQVSRLGDDCWIRPDTGELPGDSPISTPTIAVQIPRPVTEPVAWEREDVVFSCDWEPDPSTPLTLYYTDAECDLGNGETVIRDSDRFESWLSQALQCDQARWCGSDSTMVPPGGGPMPGWDGNHGGPGMGGHHGPPENGGHHCGKDSTDVPTEPPPPPPTWVGIEVDFTTHAVLILRSGPQDRWGGGIWLDGIHVTEAGTVIDYTVTEPSGECPTVEPGIVLQPTVAIRVPLPITEPVTWNRRTEAIDCGWRDGGPMGGTEPGTGGGPRPH